MHNRDNMVLALGPGNRPSSKAKRKADKTLTEPPKDHVQLLAFRRESGMDLKTGAMLTGEEAKHWLRLWAGLSEEFHPSEREPVEWNTRVACLVKADKKSVTYLTDHLRQVTLNRVVETKVVNGRKKRTIKVSLAESVATAAA